MRRVARARVQIVLERTQKHILYVYIYVHKTTASNAMRAHAWKKGLCHNPEINVRLCVWYILRQVDADDEWERKEGERAQHPHPHTHAAFLVSNNICASMFITV